MSVLGLLLLLPLRGLRGETRLRNLVRSRLLLLLELAHWWLVGLELTNGLLVLDGLLRSVLLLLLRGNMVLCVGLTPQHTEPDDSSVETDDADGPDD